MPLPKKINRPCYDTTKPNEQHQFDQLYATHNVLEGKTYKCILTGIEVASRYKIARVVMTKKTIKVTFALEAINKKGGVSKHPKVFQCDNGSELKSYVTKVLEKHNVDIRITTKYKHTHTAFVEAFNKELAKQLFMPIGA